MNHAAAAAAPPLGAAVAAQSTVLGILGVEKRYQAEAAPSTDQFMAELMLKSGLCQTLVHRYIQH